MSEPNKKRFNYIAIAGLISASCVLGGSIPVFDFANGEESELKEEVKLYVGETKIISVSKPKRVAIGNPKVADIADITEEIIVITPVGEGVTILNYWDDTGQHFYNIRVVAEGLQDIKSRVDEILKNLDVPGVETKVIESEGKLFLLGEVKSAQDKTNIDLALGSVKKKVTNLIKVMPEDLVEIEAQIVELNKDASRTLGFTWPNNISLTEKGSPGIAVAGTKWSTLFKVLNLNRDSFGWKLDALVQEGKANLLSKPKLVCLSGKEAELLVGGEKPIFTTEVVGSGTGSSGTNVEYKEYGVKLKIKPVVSKSRINLALNIEVSEVGDAEIIGSSTAPTAKAYPLTKRTVSTEVSLEDNQTLGIGGLIKQSRKEEITKTPFLGDIPILGVLFKKRVTKRGGGFGEGGDTELFIVLTPRIVTAKKEIKEQAAVPEAIKEISVAETSVASFATPVVMEQAVTPETAQETSTTETPVANSETSVNSEQPIGVVLLAKRDIPAEALIGEEDIEIKQVPLAVIQPGATKTLEGVIGQRTSDPILTGEQILSTKLLPVITQETTLTVEPSEVVKNQGTLSAGDKKAAGDSLLDVCCTDDSKGEDLLSAAVISEKNLNPSTTEYIQTVRAAILEKLEYPAAAQKSGYQGKVKLRLHIGSSGELLAAAVEDSSNYDILDNSALSAAKNIPFYSPFPSAISVKDLWLDIPIDYQLN